nr:MAG TPA: hypothetical protein [Caudoviricetes sp.]
MESHKYPAQKFFPPKIFSPPISPPGVYSAP